MWCHRRLHLQCTTKDHQFPEIRRYMKQVEYHYTLLQPNVILPNPHQAQ